MPRLSGRCSQLPMGFTNVANGTRVRRRLLVLEQLDSQQAVHHDAACERTTSVKTYTNRNAHTTNKTNSAVRGTRLATVT